MSTAKSPVRILVAGPGLIGRKHIELVRANPDSRLAGLIAPSKPAHFDFAAELGVPIYATVEDALDAGIADGLIVASPNHLHAEQALAAIERRIPVLVEKPLATTLGEAKSLVQASEEQGVAVLVGHHRTYNPILAAARAFVQSARFGSPVALQGAALLAKPDDYFASAPWRRSEGGGPVLINLIHDIGVIRFLFGEIESVAARLSSAVRGFEVEDSAALTMSFANGALGTFILSDSAASSKSWELTTAENPAYPHQPGENCYHLAGTLGSIDIPSMRFRTYGSQDRRSWHSPFETGQLPVEAADPLTIQLAHFLDVIRGDAEPLVPALDGYRNMAMIEAVRRSAASGCGVRLDGVGE